MKIIQRAELANQQKPADGWQIIEAHGEHPSHITQADGELVPCITVVDNEAISAMVTAGVPTEGLLVDKDHLSHDMNQSTEALAWVRELAACPREDDPEQYDLAAWLELTAAGRPLISGKVYKYFSTEYMADNLQDLGGGRFRPVQLDGLAYTNRPNNPGQRPISNRGTATPNQTKTKTMNITESDIMTALAKLGLGEEATGEDLIAAIDDLQLSVQNSEQAVAEEIVKNTDTEGELDEEESKLYADEIVKNRERGVRLLNRRLQKREQKENAAVAPSTMRPRAVLNSSDHGGRNRMIATRAHEIQHATGKDWTTCYNEARRELRA